MRLAPAAALLVASAVIAVILNSRGTEAQTLKWVFNAAKKFEPGSHILSSPILDSTATLYFGGEGFFLAIYTTGSAAGTLKWKFQTGGLVRSSPILDANATLYITSPYPN